MCIYVAENSNYLERPPSKSNKQTNECVEQVKIPRCSGVSGGESELKTCSKKHTAKTTKFIYVFKWRFVCCQCRTMPIAWPPHHIHVFVDWTEQTYTYNAPVTKTEGDGETKLLGFEYFSNLCPHAPSRERVSERRRCVCVFFLLPLSCDASFSSLLVVVSLHTFVISLILRYNGHTLSHYMHISYV